MTPSRMRLILTIAALLLLAAAVAAVVVLPLKEQALEMIDALFTSVLVIVSTIAGYYFPHR